MAMFFFRYSDELFDYPLSFPILTFIFIGIPVKDSLIAISLAYLYWYQFKKSNKKERVTLNLGFSPKINEHYE